MTFLSSRKRRKMHILWNPESGTCSHCGNGFKSVRRFTSDDHHSIFCHSCWKKAQQERREHVMDNREWRDDIAITFDCEIESYGTTQDAIWN